MDTDGSGQRSIVSYVTLRRTVGVLGIALPVLLVIVAWVLAGWSAGIEKSISDYYGTGSRNLFVGILFTIGWFLFSYRGYEWQDDIAGDLACVCALGVALFPITSEMAWVRGVHLTAAGSLFTILAYFSYFLFTKSGKDTVMTEKKKVRNWIYRYCGVVIMSCIGMIVLYSLMLADTGVARLKPVFWLESFALWAFGISWFIKGETLFKDINSA